MKPRIVFTGGGTAGHVTPNLALIEALQAEGWQVDYIGSKASVEQHMIEEKSIPFHAISSGKLRRYFSWKNLVDPFKILAGIAQSWRLLHRLKTDVVFSKGGFVSFPVVVAAWLHHIPVVAHESDMSPGLANRLSFPFIDTLCVTFPATKKHFKNKALVEVTGTPIRSELFKGSQQKGLELCCFVDKKPCLLVIGGSQGANKLNQIVRESLAQLNQTWQVIHLCGKGKKESSLLDNKEYCQFEYASETLPDLLAAADLVISRAGANSLCEILALQKPHVLVPLSARVSRGDQIQNALFFSQQGISTVIDDDTMTSEQLIKAVNEVNQESKDRIAKMQLLDIQSATLKIVTIIKEQLYVKSPEAV